jgi:hypothetical protein
MIIPGGKVEKQRSFHGKLLLTVEINKIVIDSPACPCCQHKTIISITSVLCLFTRVIKIGKEGNSEKG